MFGFVWQLGYSQLYITCVLFVYFGDLFLHFHELDSQEADFFFFFFKELKKAGAEISWLSVSSMSQVPKAPNPSFTIMQLEIIWLNLFVVVAQPEITLIISSELIFSNSQKTSYSCFHWSSTPCDH